MRCLGDIDMGEEMQLAPFYAIAAVAVEDFVIQERLDA
jgi:hypothetical protein